MNGWFRRLRDLIDVEDPRALRKLLFVATVAVVLFSLPTPDGLSEKGMLTLALFGTIIAAWATEAIPLPVTALGAGVGLVLLGIVEKPNDAWHPYAQDTIFFILGSLMLADAVTKTGADRAIATRFLGKFGNSTDGLLLAIVAATALPAMLISDHAVAAVMLTIVVSLLRATGLHKQKNIAAAYVLAIAFGANIAGLATPSGGARNAVVLGYLDELYGVKISYLDWASRAMPITLLLIPVVFLLLKFVFRVPHEPIDRTKLNLRKDPWTPQQGIALSVLVFTVILWVTIGEHVGLGTIAILGAVLMFVLGILDWVDTRGRITWGVPFIYGAALTMGAAMQDTGAADWLANSLLSGSWTDLPSLLIIGTLLVTVLLTNFMSDGGTAAVVAPITMAVAVASSFPVQDIGMLTAIGSAFSFLMVIGTPPNVIAYSSGLFTAKDLVKVGAPMTAAAIGLTFLAAKFWWPLLS